MLLAYSKAIDICSELKMDGNEKKNALESMAILFIINKIPANGEKAYIQYDVIYFNYSELVIKWVTKIVSKLSTTWLKWIKWDSIKRTFYM